VLFLPCAAKILLAGANLLTRYTQFTNTRQSVYRITWTVLQLSTRQPGLKSQCNSHNKGSRDDHAHFFAYIHCLVCEGSTPLISKPVFRQDVELVLFSIFTTHSPTSILMIQSHLLIVLVSDRFPRSLDTKLLYLPIVVTCPPSKSCPPGHRPPDDTRHHIPRCVISKLPTDRSRAEKLWLVFGVMCDVMLCDRERDIHPSQKFDASIVVVRTTVGVITIIWILI
jgi:hypothetical protein